MVARAVADVLATLPELAELREHLPSLREEQGAFGWLADVESGAWPPGDPHAEPGSPQWRLSFQAWLAVNVLAGDPDRVQQAIEDAVRGELARALAHLDPPASTPPPTAAPQDRRVVPGGGDAAGRFAGVLRRLSQAREGGRNSTLHWAACRAGEMIAEGALDRDKATAALSEVAAELGLTRREIAATVASGLRTGGGS